MFVSLWSAQPQEECSQAKCHNYCSDETHRAKHWGCEHRWLGQCFATCIINLREKLLKAHLVIGKVMQKNVFRRKHEGHLGKEKSEKVQRDFLLTSVSSDIEEAVKPCQRHWKYRPSWARLLILTYKKTCSLGASVHSFVVLAGKMCVVVLN